MGEEYPALPAVPSQESVELVLATQQAAETAELSGSSLEQLGTRCGMPGNHHPIEHLPANRVSLEEVEATPERLARVEVVARARASSRAPHDRPPPSASEPWTSMH